MTEPDFGAAGAPLPSWGALLRELFWIAYEVQYRAENPWPFAPSPAREVWDALHELINLEEAAILVLVTLASGATTDRRQGYLGASLVEDYLGNAQAKHLSALEEVLPSQPLLRLALRSAFVDPDDNPLAAAWLERARY